MIVDPVHDAIARYVDAKADVARRKADAYPQDAWTHRQVARVLDNLADEIRMGLAV
jgi:hypothetical protein